VGVGTLWVQVGKKLGIRHFSCIRKGWEERPAFLLILGMDVVVDGGAEPVALCVIQDGGQGVRHVDDPPRVATHHEQEPVRRLQDQVFQLVICNN
jgi:hypothetical protein